MRIADEGKLLLPQALLDFFFFLNWRWKICSALKVFDCGEQLIEFKLSI